MSHASLRVRFLAPPAACLLLLHVAGCGNREIPAKEDALVAAKNTDSSNRATDNQVIPRLYDGFEGQNLEGFWLPGNYGTGLYVPGAMKLTTNYARSGRKSVEITVHEGDIAASGDGDTTVERAELDSGHFNLFGRDAWYGFSVLVPRDFPIVDVRLVISSCKQSDVSRPLTGQRFRNGRHTLTVESQGKKKEFNLPKLPLGRWVDFVCHARYSAGQDVIFEMWMDARQVAAYSGPLADPASKNAFYHKIGLYRDRMPQPMRIYFDNYSMGNSYRAVDPARFQSNGTATQ